MHLFRHNFGFTLIELILVILIIGILSVMSLPKIFAISTEARIAALEGVQGTLCSASSLYAAYAEIENVDDGNITVNGHSIQIANGYPEGHWNNAFRYMLNITGKEAYTDVGAVCPDPLCGVGNQGSLPFVPEAIGGSGVMVWPEGFRLTQGCFTYYYNKHNGEPPITGVVSDGC